MKYTSELIKDNYYRITTTFNDENITFDCVVNDVSELNEVVQFTLDNRFKTAITYVPKYSDLRRNEYPPITDYLDGVVKNDQAQIDSYIAICKAIKEKYPKN